MKSMKSYKSKGSIKSEVFPAGIQQHQGSKEPSSIVAQNKSTTQKIDLKKTLQKNQGDSEDESSISDQVYSQRHDGDANNADIISQKSLRSIKSHRKEQAPDLELGSMKKNTKKRGSQTNIHPPNQE